MGALYNPLSPKQCRYVVRHQPTSIEYVGQNYQGVPPENTASEDSKHSVNVLGSEAVIDDKPCSENETPAAEPCSIAG